MANSWAACNKHCPGMKNKTVGYLKRPCAGAEKGEQCDIPFTYQGFTYHGCIEGNDEKTFWCKKLKAGEGKLKLIKCSDSCPRDVILSKERLSKNELMQSLRKEPSVYTKIDLDESCEELFPIKEWKMVLITFHFISLFIMLH